MIWLRYALLLLIFPAYVIALSRRRWTTIPLWLVSGSVMVVQLALNAQQNLTLSDGTAPSAFLWIVEATKIMFIPFAVQFAVMLKADQSRVADRAGNGTRVLIADWNTREF
jgi:hypothetical protein